MDLATSELESTPETNCGLKKIGWSLRIISGVVVKQLFDKITSSSFTVCHIFGKFRILVDISCSTYMLIIFIHMY
jgi:hypothetical protein